MNAGARAEAAAISHSWRWARLPALSRGFLLRALATAALVILSHQVEWRWLRFLTSEAILRLSALLGLATTRVSFDTVRMHGEVFRFVISCTFVDVVAGAIPLVWAVRKSVRRNLATVVIVGAGLFTFNILRLELGQLLFAWGSPWIAADELLGGVTYFVVWLFLAYAFGGNWKEGCR